MKPGPTPTRIFGFGVFSRVFGYTMSDTLPKVRGVKILRSPCCCWEGSLNGFTWVCARLQALSSYSALVNPKQFLLPTRDSSNFPCSELRETEKELFNRWWCTTTTYIFLCNIQSLFLALFLLFSSHWQKEGEIDYRFCFSIDCSMQPYTRLENYSIICYL